MNPSETNQSKELREELEQIVTRNGNSGRTPELLEAELDQLVNLITTRETEAEQRTFDEANKAHSKELRRLEKIHQAELDSLRKG
jgi:hypothetical protein